MPDATLEFDTVMCFSASLMGNGNEGAVMFNFLTPPGQPNYRTILGPASTAQMGRTLADAAASIPNLSRVLMADVPGQSLPDAKAVHYFGQDYDPAILQALGVLVIRANLLEKNLVLLFARLLSLKVDQAAAVFYSTVNMKGRMDMIQAATYEAGLSEAKLKSVLKALDKAQAVMARRNVLIHSQWSFKDGGFQIEAYKPNTATQHRVKVISAKDVETLAADYRVAGLTVASLVFDAANMATNTARTPSSGEPSN